MHKLNQQYINDEEPESPTPCLSDPERWHPDEQQPDPAAIAACWSCHFQSRCARRALSLHAEFGIWGGYRLAPGPGLARSRQQLHIVAGLEVGPPASPGAAVLLELQQPHTTAASADNGATDAMTVDAEMTTVDAEMTEPSAASPAAPDITSPIEDAASVVALHARPTPRYCRPRPLPGVTHRVPAQAG